MVLSGCMSTTLSHYSASPHIEKINTFQYVKRVNITFEPTDKQEQISFTGFQYLLLAFPFGRIYSDRLKIDLFEAIREQAALKGIAINPVAFSNQKTSGSSISPEIRIKTGEFDLNAYDYLFIRHITCSLSLNFNMTMPETNLVNYSSEIEGQASSWMALGFKPELSFVYHQCLKDIADKTAEKLLFLLRTQ
jgi:hypothetical protein